MLDAAIDLDAGDPGAIDLGSWELTAGDVREYLTAVGDELSIYCQHGFAPPLLLAARVVGRLLDRLSLPDGAIHSLQDVETVCARASALRCPLPPGWSRRARGAGCGS